MDCGAKRSATLFHPTASCDRAFSIIVYQSGVALRLPPQSIETIVCDAFNRPQLLIRSLTHEEDVMDSLWPGGYKVRDGRWETAWRMALLAAAAIICLPPHSDS